MRHSNSLLAAFPVINFAGLIVGTPSNLSGGGSGVSTKEVVNNTGEEGPSAYKWSKKARSKTPVEEQREGKG